MEKFILTRELGRLAKWLRLLGFDTQYFTENKISSLIIQALRDNRIILTRSLTMPDMHGKNILFIKSEHVKEQIAQVLKDLNLKPDKSRMFSRCIVCNVKLEKIEKRDIKDKIPEYVFRTQENFATCSQCKRVYWEGTHWGRAQETLEEIKKYNHGIYS